MKDIVILKSYLNTFTTVKNPAAFTSSQSTMETQERRVKSIQSKVNNKDTTRSTSV